jgi:hypothetical protein
MKNNPSEVKIELNTATIVIAPEFMRPFQSLFDSVWAQVFDQDEDEEGRLTCNISPDQLKPCDHAFLASIFHNFETVEEAQEFLSSVLECPVEDRHEWYAWAIISIANKGRYR